MVIRYSLPRPRPCVKDDLALVSSTVGDGKKSEAGISLCETVVWPPAERVRLRVETWPTPFLLGFVHLKGLYFLIHLFRGEVPFLNSYEGTTQANGNPGHKELLMPLLEPIYLDALVLVREKEAFLYTSRFFWLV